MANLELLFSWLLAIVELVAFKTDITSSSVSGKNESGDICVSEMCNYAALKMKSSIDYSIDPCSNFYEFACGNWVKNHRLPPGEVKYGQLESRMKTLNEQLQVILSSEISSDDNPHARRAKNFYRDCVNTESMNTRGLTPLIDLIEFLGGWPVLGNWNESNYDIANVLYESRGILNTGRMFGAGRQGILVSAYPALGQFNHIFLTPPSFFADLQLLNNLEDESKQEKVQAMRSYIKEIILEVRQAMNVTTEDESELHEKINKIIEFESELADSVLDINTVFVQTAVLSIDDFQQSLFSNSSLNQWAQIEWQSFLEKYFGSKVNITSDFQVVLFQPNYFENLQQILSDTPLETVANYIVWRVVAALVPETTDRMREVQFQYAQDAMKFKEPIKRSKVCAEVGADKEARYYYWGYAIVLEYSKKYFSPEKKHHMLSMVNYIREALIKLIQDTQNLSNSTKEAIVSQMELMEHSVAYADWTTNITALDEFYAELLLDLKQGRHFENHIKFRTWQVDQELQKLNIPPKQIKTDLSPLDIQAHFDGNRNRMVFAAGIAGPPFYHTSSAPSYLNFASLGHIISHELTHGYFGIAEQHVNPTLKELEARLDTDNCIRKSYLELDDTGEIYNGTHWTIEEDTADVGGIHVAYAAYKSWELENRPEGKLYGMENFTSDQLFFLTMAQMWCENVDASTLQHFIMREAHGPGRLRVLGPLVNSESFSNAWNCPKDTNMNPTTKCRIW